MPFELNTPCPFSLPSGEGVRGAIFGVLHLGDLKQLSEIHQSDE